MSGGYFDYKNYLLREWGEDQRVRRECPVLGDLLTDLDDVMHAMDYWFSGDSGCESFRKAWGKFVEKWFNTPYGEMVRQVITSDVERKLDNMLGTKEAKE